MYMCIDLDIHRFTSILVCRIDAVCIGYITRCRSLRDLHTEGRRPRGCVNREETEPSDVTDLYHGLRSHNNASLP